MCVITGLLQQKFGFGSEKVRGGEKGEETVEDDTLAFGILKK